MISFASVAASAQNVTISGGTPAYSVSGCTGLALGAIGGGTLQVTPQAIGACSLIVTDTKGNQAALSVSETLC